MAKARIPKVDALVLCKSIGTDAEHTRYDLLDVVRGRIEGREFPLKLPVLGVYISLTGMQGSYDLAVEIASLVTGKVVRGTGTTSPMLIDDPLQLVSQFLPLPDLEFPDRGRYVCRLIANGATAHETAFDVDWPKPQRVEGKMSPQSFARGLARLRGRNPTVDDAMLARIAGVGGEVLALLATDPRGLLPEVIGSVITRLATHFRMRPEEFFEEFP